MEDFVRRPVARVLFVEDEPEEADWAGGVDGFVTPPPTPTPVPKTPKKKKKRPT